SAPPRSAPVPSASPPPRTMRQRRRSVMVHSEEHGQRRQDRGGARRIETLARDGRGGAAGPAPPPAPRGPPRRRAAPRPPARGGEEGRSWQDGRLGERGEPAVDALPQRLVVEEQRRAAAEEALGPRAGALGRLGGGQRQPGPARRLGPVERAAVEEEPHGAAGEEPVGTVEPGKRAAPGRDERGIVDRAQRGGGRLGSAGRGAWAASPPTPCAARGGPMPARVTIEATTAATTSASVLRTLP